MSSEHLLWEGIRNNDVRSLESLYTTYNDTLYNYGKKFTGDSHLVEDAIQETFIALWKYRHTMTVTGNFNYYLLRAFRNQLLRLIRENARTAYTDEQPDFHFEVGFDHRLIAGEEQALLSRQVQQALARLTSRQREIIYFRFFEGLSFEEIAGIMNMQVRATYKLTARALSTLRAMLDGTGAGSLVLLAIIRQLG